MFSKRNINVRTRAQNLFKCSFDVTLFAKKRAAKIFCTCVKLVFIYVFLSISGVSRGNLDRWTKSCKISLHDFIIKRAP